MDLYLFLELMALVLTAVLIYHSGRTRGSVFTGMFFIGGAVLGIVRENIVALFTPLYAYNSETFHLWIGAAPLILAVFWSYTIYISLSLSESIVRGSWMTGRRRGFVVLGAMLFMAAYACFNEAFSSIFPMVLWKFEPEIAIWGGTPVMVLWGYAGMALIFLLFLYFIYGMRLSGVLRTGIMCLAALVMVPLHLAWLFLFKTIPGSGLFSWHGGRVLHLQPPGRNAISHNRFVIIMHSFISRPQHCAEYPR